MLLAKLWSPKLIVTMFLLPVFIPHLKATRLGSPIGSRFFNASSTTDIDTHPICVKDDTMVNYVFNSIVVNSMTR